MRPRVEVDLRAPGAGRHADSLSRGGLFVPGEELALSEECEVLILGPDQPVIVAARVVFADGTGIGVELALEPALRAQLVALAAAAPGEDDTVQDDGQPQGGGYDPEDSGEYTVDEPVAMVGPDGLAIGTEPPPMASHGAVVGGVIDDEPLDPALLDPETLDGETVDPEGPTTRADRQADAEDGGERAPRNVYERMRGLTLVQQFKFARAGELHERIALERIYGKTVWEQLLRNPRITAAEVARIARMGNLPRPQLEQIVGNGAWLAVPEIRRALLANTRLTAEMIPRILRHLPKHELKLMPVQLAYPAAVREVARKMLKAAE